MTHSQKILLIADLIERRTASIPKGYRGSEPTKFFLVLDEHTAKPALVWSQNLSPEQIENSPGYITYRAGGYAAGEWDEMAERFGTWLDTATQQQEIKQCSQKH